MPDNTNIPVAPVAPSAPVCGACNQSGCSCPTCTTCNQRRLTEDICGSCHQCTYNGCCNCWTCSNCSQNYAAGTPCASCSHCASCCSCVRCAGCSRTLRNDLCVDCDRCDRCCNCPEPGRVAYFNAPNPPVFHSSDRDKYITNPSKRFISAEIEVAQIGEEKGIGNSIALWHGAVVHDGSLPDTGFEINTAPANGDKYVNQINRICNALKESNAKATTACGLHIHVDAREFNYYDIRKLAYIYQKVENALFSLVSPSRRNSRYCIPCGDKLVRDLEKNIIPKDNEKTLIKNIYGRDENIQVVKEHKYHDARYNALNLHSWVYRGTVENRMHHGTVNAEKIINWGILNAAMVDFAFDNTEKDIKKLKGDSVSILLEMCPTQNVKDWVLERIKKFRRELPTDPNNEASETF